MRSEKRELSFCVIEAGHIGPRLCVMAGFAAEARTVGPVAFHAIVEFAMMRIGVAGGAGHIVKMERQNFVGAMRLPCRVATGARHCGMRSGQRETGFAVFRNGVKSAMEIDDRVTSLAPVVVGHCRKLIVMHVLVAVCTIGEFDFVLRVFSGRRVALRTIDGDVFSLERVL